MYKNTYIHNPLVSENNFRTKSADLSDIPSYDKSLLPQPYWQGHDSVIACYDKAWEIAFKNIKSPTNENGFVAPYIDTAYNDNIFMWDSSFMCMFGVYGRRIFNFQTTLDNFYRKQHPDGFICREISQLNGQDLFQRYDPVSTGPNIMPWAEWEYYQRTGDISRLEEIFPVLVSYHQWLMSQRTWKDGTYWSSGWGTGMDNQPRLPSGYHQNYSHGHMTWLD
ncbi:glycoside hydrolase, partial [Francisellaceae bacterium]|nr:glycoside hydrolase [Francisellaceae bacterium]